MRASIRKRSALVFFGAVWLLVGATSLGSFSRALIWRSGPYDRFGVDCGRVFVVAEWWGPGFELAVAGVAREPGWRLDIPSPFHQDMLWPHRIPYWGGTLISCPMWIPLSLAAFLLWCGWTRSVRNVAGCRRCGYDLTGNVSGTCPECGTACRQGGRCQSRQAASIASRSSQANGTNSTRPRRGPRHAVPKSW